MSAVLIPALLTIWEVGLCRRDARKVRVRINNTKKTTIREIKEEHTIRYTKRTRNGKSSMSSKKDEKKQLVNFRWRWNQLTQVMLRFFEEKACKSDKRIILENNCWNIHTQNKYFVHWALFNFFQPSIESSFPANSNLREARIITNGSNNRLLGDSLFMTYLSILPARSSKLDNTPLPDDQRLC